MRLMQHIPVAFVGGLLALIIPRILGWSAWPFSREDWFVLGGLLVGEIAARSIFRAKRGRASPQ